MSEAYGIARSLRVVQPGDRQAGDPGVAEPVRRATGTLRDGTPFVGVIGNLRCRIVDGVLTLGGTISGAGPTVDVQPFRTTVGIDQIGVDRSRTTLTLPIGRLSADHAGSIVELDPLQLDVTAVPERSQLLGNLLCWLADLLDTEDQPQATAALLNRILSWSGLGR